MRSAQRENAFSGRGRRLRTRSARERVQRSRAAPPNALSAAECERVLAELNSTRFADKSVGQCWATLLDEGTYLCSMSTMHRLLRRTGQAGERRAKRPIPPGPGPSYSPPHPSTSGLGDITKLRGPARGVYYDLYVILDIFSRYVVGWTVAARESAEIAEDLIGPRSAFMAGCAACTPTEARR